MKTAYITRYNGDKNQSLGNLIVFNSNRSLVFNSHLLERGWQDNKRNISCIPEGTYKLVLEYSHKFSRYLWEVKGVPNRSECKFHAASFWKNLNGCFSPGLAKWDINNDGYKDMIYSTDALEEFMDAMGSDTEARLVVIDDYAA
ncbi:DUF5675 family protein [uncultured Wocania sp.]|uniref:DUF5675 family protein n=1 Tax=uncultured Wocania sp. TaxID=2834404 RepID=UPI0030F943A5